MESAVAGRRAFTRPVKFGLLGFAALLALYWAAVTAVSGWRFALQQFAEFWYFIVPLAAGFGTQVALYCRLREVVSSAVDSRTIVAASGTTSTAAMISCCAHYLVNVAPVLGASGLVAFAAQFQVQLFWLGLLFNLGGVAFIARKLMAASRHHASMLAARRA